MCTPGERDDSPESHRRGIQSIARQQRGVLPRIGDGDGVVAEGEEPDVASEDGDQLQMWLSELVDDDDPVVVHSLVGLPSLMDRRAVARASAGLESRASSSTVVVAPPEPLASEAAAQESDGAVDLHAWPLATQSKASGLRSSIATIRPIGTPGGR